MKTIWLTSLVTSEEKVKQLIPRLKTYGLEVRGHFWEDDLEKMTWSKPREELMKPEVSLWLIMTSNEQLALPSIRYGLSLLALTIQASRGLSFPMGILLTEGSLPASETPPTSLQGADVLSLSDPNLGAMLVGKVHTAGKPVLPEYRLDVYGNPQIGQWFEVGPKNTSWHGAMFGVAGGEITFHAVGPKGKLPEQSVLHYPLKGLKVNLGEKEHTAWAAQNELDSETSYFIKVSGFPESILFGSYSTQEETEVYVVRTK